MPRPTGTVSASSARTRIGSGLRAPRATVLVLVDACALAVFVGLGLRAHGTSTVVAAAARIVVPLSLAWLGATLMLGTYRRRDVRSLLQAWALAVPAAMLARAWWAGSPRGASLAVFLAVGMAFTLLVLLLGRAAASLAVDPGSWRRRDG